MWVVEGDGWVNVGCQFAAKAANSTTRAAMPEVQRKLAPCAFHATQVPAGGWDLACGLRRRGTQRSGDKGARGEGARSEQRRNVDVDDRRGDRNKADRRTRVDIDIDGARRGYRADRRRSGGGDIDVNVRGFGYTPTGCQDLTPLQAMHRALIVLLPGTGHLRCERAKDGS